MSRRRRAGEHVGRDPTELLLELAEFPGAAQQGGDDQAGSSDPPPCPVPPPGRGRRAKGGSCSPAGLALRTGLVSGPSAVPLWSEVMGRMIRSYRAVASKLQVTRGAMLGVIEDLRRKSREIAAAQGQAAVGVGRGLRFGSGDGDRPRPRADLRPSRAIRGAGGHAREDRERERRARGDGQRSRTGAAEVDTGAISSRWPGHLRAPRSGSGRRWSHSRTRAGAAFAPPWFRRCVAAKLPRAPWPADFWRDGAHGDAAAGLGWGPAAGR